jgi:hypothetical protein
MSSPTIPVERTKNKTPKKRKEKKRKELVVRKS